MYGLGVAVCARPALGETEPASLHRHTRDVLSARPIAVANHTPIVCSAGGTDPLLLSVMRDCGLPVGTDLREFRSETEFCARVAEVMSDGLRISMEYPQPTALCPGERAVKSAQLVGYLNNKASIGVFVDPRFQAIRSVVRRGELAEATPVEKSWVLKGATSTAHSGPLDVYIHQAGEQVELPAFTNVLSEFVIEEYLHISFNWGIQLWVGPDAKGRIIATTEQRVDPAGIYTGGRFGLVTPVPAELLAECEAIAQRAADLGYRGLGSVDCAQTQDGRLVVIDLNFRIASGSVPLLALQAVRPEALDRPAESMKLTVAAPLAELVSELRAAITAGELLIIAGHDTNRTDNSIKLCALQILVFGDDSDEVIARRSRLETRFSR